MVNVGYIKLSNIIADYGIAGSNVISAVQNRRRGAYKAGR